MKSRFEREIGSNLARARASIGAAKELFSSGYYDFVASRAYYASFYAATALPLSQELEFRRHSGVISSIHRCFVRTGKLDERYGRDLNWLFELRGIGDYGVTVHVTPEDAEKAIAVAEDFLEVAKALIREEI